MSIQGMLFRAMERAESPRAIRMIARGLEMVTGVKSNDVALNVSDTDWYARNGYRVISALGGSQSYTGKSITVDASLESAAFLAGIKIISEDIASLPFFIYRRSKDGKLIDKAYDHPLYRILHDLWNPEVSAGEGVESLTSWALMTGVGYAYIEHDSKGRVQGLYPWKPDSVRRVVNENGVAAFEHSDRGKWEPYPRNKVLDLKGWTLDGYAGESIVQRARQVLGLTLAQQEYASRWFGQGSMLDVVLERPVGAPRLDPTGVQNLKDAWIKYHKRLGDKSFDPAVLQDGTTAKLLTPKMVDIQMVEQRREQVLEVCRLLRLTPHKLADMTRSGHASIDAENISYIQLTLSPWNRRWRQTVYRCLLTPEEQMEARLYAEQSVEAFQRGDFKAQMDAFRAALEKGVYTINEVRKWFNLNPVVGGDENRVQLNTVAIAEAATALAEQARG